MKSKLKVEDSFQIPKLDCFSSQQLRDALELGERLLMNSANRKTFVLARDQARRFSSDPGVYAIFSGDDVIYVGETGSISARMADLLDSRNHVLRRNIGNMMFADEENFTKATSSRKFCVKLEDRLAAFMVEKLCVSPVIVTFGRAEIEEHMTEKYRPKYNNKGKRGMSLR